MEILKELKTQVRVLESQRAKRWDRSGFKISGFSDITFDVQYVKLKFDNLYMKSFDIKTFIAASEEFKTGCDKLSNAVPALNPVLW